MKKEKIVAVFGSSAVKPHELDYVAAYDLGKTLAINDYTVMTGGYSGVMEAISRGASQEGGNVIGVTSEAIEAIRDGIQPNRWVAVEVRHKTLRDRLMYLITEADAYVVMPGGLGTLTEVVLVWELMRVGEISRRPIVCFGDYWGEMLVGLRYSQYIQSQMWDYITFVDTEQELLEALATESTPDGQTEPQPEATPPPPSDLPIPPADAESTEGEDDAN